jgi:hypothetical protein
MVAIRMGRLSEAASAGVSDFDRVGGRHGERIAEWRMLQRWGPKRPHSAHFELKPHVL